MDTLYVYEVDKETGEVTKDEINQFIRIHRGYCAELIFLCTKHGKHYEVRNCNLDKLVNNKLVTFENDDRANYAKMVDSIVEKRQKAYREYHKWDKLIRALEMRREE